jgi:hypothetical protein
LVPIAFFYKEVGQLRKVLGRVSISINEVDFQIFFEDIVVHISESAGATVNVLATHTPLVRHDVVVVVVYLTAAAANEWLRLLVDPLKYMLAIIHLTPKSLDALLFNLLVVLHTLVVALPNITHLGNWAEVGPLELIQEVVEVIGAFDKFRGICLDR